MLLFTIFIIVVTQKLVLQQSKNVTAKCTETLSPPPCIQFSLCDLMICDKTFFSKHFSIFSDKILLKTYILHEMKRNRVFATNSLLATQCCRRYVFQNINSVRSYDISLEHQRLTLSGYKDIGIIKFELVAKTQFLEPYLNYFFSPSTPFDLT